MQVTKNTPPVKNRNLGSLQVVSGKVLSVAGGRNPRQAELGEGGTGNLLERCEGVSCSQVSGPQKDLDLSPGKGGEAGVAAPRVCLLPAALELPPASSSSQSSQPRGHVAGGKQEAGTGPSGLRPHRP